MLLFYYNPLPETKPNLMDSTMGTGLFFDLTFHYPYCMGHVRAVCGLCTGHVLIARISNILLKILYPCTPLHLYGPFSVWLLLLTRTLPVAFYN